MWWSRRWSVLEKESGLEEELRKWQAERARKQAPLAASTDTPVARDRRTVRINGRSVEIIKKPKRAAAQP